MKLRRLHYGWVMVVIAVCVLTTYGTTFYIFGIFLRPLSMEFGWDRGALSLAQSISMVASGGLSILTGRLSDKYGPRLLVTAAGLLIGTGFLLMSRVSSLWQVYLIWGLSKGVGGSGVFIPIVSTIPRWFARKRGIAVGITVTGIGLGGMISPLIIQWLISSYGWRQAFIILGLIISIIIIPLAQLMKHSPERIGLRPYGEDGTIEDRQSLASVGGLSLKQAIKTSHFWFFGSILFCFYFAGAITTHIVPHAIDIGISAIVAASILSIIAGSGVISRFSIGFISDRIGARRVLTACLVMATLALIWPLFAKEIWMFYVFAVIFGIAHGGIMSLRPLISAELFGLGSLGMIFATIELCSLTGGALGAPLAGAIFDVTGSYSLAFLILVIMGALAVILSLILLKVRADVAVTK